MAEIDLPEGFQELKTQVAGHTFEATNAKAVGLLLDAKTGCVLKPLGKPECGERETKFYERIKKAKAAKDQQHMGGQVMIIEGGDVKESERDLLVELSELVPKFHQKLELKVNQRELMFLRMENLAHGMRKPCIMDIKIGQRTWDPLATEEKRLVEEQKYRGCKKFLGLCLPGFQLFKYPNGDFTKHSKEYGKKLDVGGFGETVATFLNADNPKSICSPLIREVLKQLYAIRSWFHKQRFLHFYASSLLLVYDYSVLKDYLDNESNGSYLTNGNCQLSNNGNVDCLIQNDLDGKKKIHKMNIINPSKWVQVKMIDFAHVFPSENNSLDLNYLYGLENLTRFIEKILQHE